MDKRRRGSGLILILISLLFLQVSCCENSGPPRITVKIAIPYEDRLSGIDNQYYKSWLEEQSGVSIDFTFIPQTYSSEYLRLLFTSDDSDVDAVFFSEQSALSPEELEYYGMNGYLLPLEELINKKGHYFTEAAAAYQDCCLLQAIIESDGHIYYLPAADASRAERYTQIMFINAKWLEKLKLPIPTTTDEFRDTLAAFAQAYPNALPLIGSSDNDSIQPVHFLMNSFTVCDPVNGYFAVDNGSVYFAPITAEWREGIRYCRSLYLAGLLPKQIFTFTEKQMIGVANDPQDLVGVFTAKNMADVLSENSPELLSHYQFVPPLTGPEQAGFSIAEIKRPRPGGVILSSSKNYDAVFRLMDLMCSEDAYLIGHYGEHDADWAQASVGDITIFGEPAVITIKNPELFQRNVVSGVTGPFIGNSKYTDGIAWKGYQINQSEYLAARAYRSYKPYEPPESLCMIHFSDNASEKKKQMEDISGYIKKWMKWWITGVEDIDDNAAWNEYLDGLYSMNLKKLLESIQITYEEMRKNNETVH